jgi:hypothetical protein
MIQDVKYYEVWCVTEEGSFELENISGFSWGINPQYVSDEENRGYGRGAFDPESIQYTWNKKTGSGKPDFVRAYGNAFTISDKTKALFYPLVDGFVDQHRVNIDGEWHTTFYPRLFLPLFDEERSEYKLKRSGTLARPKRLLLKSSPAEPLPIFGISFHGVKKPFVIVSQRFKDIYDSEKMIGLRFKEAWPGGE